MGQNSNVAENNQRCARKKWQRACLLLIPILYFFSIPWFWNSGQDVSWFLFMPTWTAVALLSYVGVAILSSIAWCLYTDDELGDIDDPKSSQQDYSTDGN